MVPALKTPRDSAPVSSSAQSEVEGQSIKNKKAEIHTVIESAKPDIILGNESWLTPDIRNSEIFPESFDVIRKDRASDAHGDVLLPLGVIFSVLKLRNWTPSAK